MAKRQKKIKTSNMTFYSSIRIIKKIKIKKKIVVDLFKKEVEETVKDRREDSYFKKPNWIITKEFIEFPNQEDIDSSKALFEELKEKVESKLLKRKRIFKIHSKKNFVTLFDETRNNSRILLKKKDYNGLVKAFNNKYKLAVEGYEKAKEMLQECKKFGSIKFIKKRTKEENYKIKKFIENPLKIVEIRQKFLKEVETIRSVYDFYSRLNCFDFKLKDAHSKFKEETNSILSFCRFKDISIKLGLKYIRKRRDYNNTEEEKNRRIHFIIELMKKYYDKNVLLLFFDATSFSNNNFKKKHWQIPFNKKGYKSKFYYNLTHMLMIIGLRKIEAFQFIKGNLNSPLIYNFLDKAVRRIKNSNPSKKICIVLDNSPLHKTEIIKSLTGYYNITFLFIPPNNPYFNVIEFVFRFLKKGLIKKTSLK